MDKEKTAKNHSLLTSFVVLKKGGSLAHRLAHGAAQLDLLRCAIGRTGRAAQGDRDVADAAALDAVALANHIVQHRRGAAEQIEAAAAAVKVAARRCKHARGETPRHQARRAIADEAQRIRPRRGLARRREQRICRVVRLRCGEKKNFLLFSVQESYMTAARAADTACSAEGCSWDSSEKCNQPRFNKKGQRFTLEIDKK